MARSATSDDVFTLEPEMQIDMPLSTPGGPFAERLQRVAQSSGDGAAKNFSDKDIGGALPGVLRGFSFEHVPHDRAMMVAVIATPIAFIACVVITIVYFGILDADGVTARQSIASDEIGRIVPSDKSILAAPALVAQPRTVDSPAEANTSTAKIPDNRAVQEWAIDVPRGAVIRDIDLQDGRLAIHLSTDTGEKFVIYDTATGSIAGNVIVGEPLPAAQAPPPLDNSLSDENNVLPENPVRADTDTPGAQSPDGQPE